MIEEPRIWGIQEGYPELCTKHLKHRKQSKYTEHSMHTLNGLNSVAESMTEKADVCWENKLNIPCEWRKTMSC